MCVQCWGLIKFQNLFGQINDVCSPKDTGGSEKFDKFSVIEFLIIFIIPKVATEIE